MNGSDPFVVGRCTFGPSCTPDVITKFEMETEMTDHPTPEDYANKAERDAAYLDEWRYEHACRSGNPSGPLILAITAFAEYRRLVREDARP